MVSLLKTFGKGILYVIGFPFFIVALLIFGAIGVFLFIIQLFKCIIYFFTGQKFFPELPEDKELRMRQEAAYAAANPTIIDNPVDDAPIVTEEDQAPIFIRQTPFYNEPEPPVQPEENNNVGSIEEACFEQQEEPKEEQKEEPRESVFVDLERNEPEQTIDISEPKEPEPEEELEEYIPKGSTFVDDIDEEDTKGGVDIDYDVR